MARRGGGGGTASATAAVGNNVPRASRSAAAAFFARIDVRRAAATMVGAAMLSRWRLREQMLDGATRGGGRATRSVIVTTEDDDDGWDLPPPPARRRWMRRCRCPLRPTTETTKTRARDDATRRVRVQRSLLCSPTWRAPRPTRRTPRAWPLSSRLRRRRGSTSTGRSPTPRCSPASPWPTMVSRWRCGAPRPAASGSAPASASAFSPMASSRRQYWARSPCSCRR